MGLLYQFPVRTNEVDFYKKESDVITVRSYGLPPIFWVYLISILVVFTFLCIAIIKPLKKLLTYPDSMSQVLAYSLIALLLITPLLLLTFYFYEKRIIRRPKAIRIEHRFFGLKIRTQEANLDNYITEIGHFMDSPNMARIQGGSESRAFQNKGYFEFFLKSADQRLLIDRSSRKIDLEHLKVLLDL